MADQYMRSTVRLLLMTLAAWNTAAAEPPAGPFLKAKTIFQTNVGYDPRLALAVDAVIVHRHGEAPEPLRKNIGSWKDSGYPVGRMFFADSDAANAYWTGKWDGRPRPDDVERDAVGNVIKCADVRPYMLPTEGWTRYLEEMTLHSLEAGADAILPEEPLAHVHSGYEKSFRELWEKRYKRPWEPESASLEARFLTAQLKNELYLELERHLARVTNQWSARTGKRVPFILPVHALYSNVASSLVAPLGTSTSVREFDGYIGQVWTGPVNWALAHYSSPDKSFFGSAYALYDYFTALTRGTRKRLWLLIDPVEDDPNHTWPEFEEWYRHCLVAALLMSDVDAYEVMPWPDRIFLPGHLTGGGTPAPETFRIGTLAAVQVLQDVPRQGQWINGDGTAAELSSGIGVAVADTLMWEKEPFPPLDPVYGLLLPLINAGVPVEACLLERSGEPRYLDRFKTIVVSYVAVKPAEAAVNERLTQWVKRGGVLVLIGEGDDLGGADLWWKKSGATSPLHHLARLLSLDIDKDGDHAVGKGWVLRRTISPRQFANPAIAADTYLPLIESALRKVSSEAQLHQPGHLCMRRGPFIVAHAGRQPLTIRGPLVNVFDAELPVIEQAVLKPGESGLYRDVAEVFDARGGQQGRPRVLFTTHRLLNHKETAGTTELLIRGPAETPAVVRLFTAGKSLHNARATGAAGAPLAVDSRVEGKTVRLKFPNAPEGVNVRIDWK